MDDLERAAAAEQTQAERRSVNRWTAGIVLGVIALCGAFALFSGGDDGPTEADLYRDAKRVCQDEFVPKRLKAPATAEYSGVQVTEAGGVYTVTGSVDSENAFGAKVRARWTCAVRSAGESWVLNSATVTG